MPIPNGTAPIGPKSLLLAGFTVYVRKGALPLVALFQAILHAKVPDFRQAPPMLDYRILARWALEVFKRG